jgi:hypothetical protein
VRTDHGHDSGHLLRSTSDGNAYDTVSTPQFDAGTRIVRRIDVPAWR